MYCAFRQFPDQPGLYCTKEQFSALGTFSCFRNVVEDPTDLCSGEISIKYKAGFLAKLFCQSFFFQRIAEFSSTTTLPDNRVADRITGILIPYDGCLALVRDFLRDNNALRVSRSLRDTAYRAMQARETLEKQLGREPTMDEIAGEAGLSRREVTAALESVVEPVSLEEPVYTDSGDAMYLIDQVRDPDGEDSWISGLQFRQTVAGLTPREKRIMELRYLQGKTQMEVAREIGISQAQVSRLEKGALSQFRTRD